MRPTKYLLLLFLLAICVSACHFRTGASASVNGQTELTDSSIQTRPYPLSSNFKVLADTLWLHQLPFTDSVPVTCDDELVVAEFAIHPEDSADSVWVKVARDQATIGWIQEKTLLENIVPVDPISQCIHWFSSARALAFFSILGIFFLWTVYRAVSKKQIKLIWVNDIDSIFPITLSWLLAAAATLYNSLQQFAPHTWECYYYNPSLNPFEQTFLLSLFLLCLWLIALVGIAMLDDLFHQTTLEVAFFYLLGLASCCIFLYIFFTYIWIYAAYLCFAAYTIWCIQRLRNAACYPYACGACGAKMKNKGICPHCGALNK